jgi:transposase-like protein
MMMCLDALIVEMRHEGRVENRAVFVAIGVNQEDATEVPGLWTTATEGAKLWRMAKILLLAELLFTRTGVTMFEL